jgi:hypothetical protein
MTEIENNQPTNQTNKQTNKLDKSKESHQLKQLIISSFNSSSNLIHNSNNNLVIWLQIVIGISNALNSAIAQVAPEIRDPPLFLRIF